MSIQERIADPFFFGQLSSLGGDLPEALLRAFEARDLIIEPSHIPAFQFDTEHKFRQIGRLATGHLVPGTKRKTLYVKPEILAQHAEELRTLLNINPKSEYEQRRLEEYCLMQSIVHLVLQAIVDFGEKDKKAVHDKFTDMNF